MWPFDSQETQPVFRLRENMEMRMTKLAVKSAYVIAPKSLFAWHRIREFQEIVRVFGKQKGYFLALDNRSSVPLSPYQEAEGCSDAMCISKAWLDKITDPEQVAQASHDFAQTESDAQQRKSRYYEFVGFGIMGLVIIMAFLIIMVMTGKIKL
jgi:hypothetical protein